MLEKAMNAQIQAEKYTTKAVDYAKQARQATQTGYMFHSS